MTSLEKPTLGTDPEKGWQFYSLHLTSVYILREFFLVSNYRRCIRNVFDYDKQVKKSIEIQEKLKGSVAHKKPILAGAEELSKWAKEMDSQDYHELYVHSFIGMWSSFEAGLENIIADFVQNDYEVAKELIGKFKTGRYKISNWPWSRSTCLEIAQKLEPMAIKATKDGGLDLFARIQTMFSWLGISIEIKDGEKTYLAEANRVRNILLHRYGEISEKDAVDFPCLSNWIGKVMPLSKEKFTNYYKGINAVLISIMLGIQEKMKPNT